MSRDDESSVIASLGGFALTDVLGDLGADFDPANLAALGLGGPASSAISREQINVAKFADEGDDDAAIGADEGDDWEAEVDRDLRRERYVSGAPATRAKLRGEDDDFDDEQEEEPMQEVRTPAVKQEEMEDDDMRGIFGSPEASPAPEPQPSPPPKKDVKALFPAFEPGAVLDFTELFAPKGAKRQRLRHTAPFKQLQLPPSYVPAPSTTDTFSRSVAVNRPKRSHLQRMVDAVWQPPGMAEGSDEESEEEWVPALHRGRRVDGSNEDFSMVGLADWEDAIIWDDHSARPSISAAEAPSINKLPPNPSLLSGEWTRSIIWDDRAPPRKTFTGLTLDMNDPALIFEEIEPPIEKEEPRGTKRSRATEKEKEKDKDPFNLSNDHHYEMSAAGPRHRIRQTFGQIDVQHAYPALKLQLPFYKTRLSKNEARSFHRAALTFPSNVELRFTKVRSGKRKKDKEKRRAARIDGGVEGVRTTKDLSLKDGGPFVLWEFSEEYPPIISNFGMGSVLVNYYRKKDPNDDHVPKADIGEPFVLDVADESPFMKLGFVQPGQTIPTLYNNLIRAPLFRHKPNPTDFLVIRSTTKTETKYYIREIKNLFTVGQTYPVTAVPGPHSRVITNTLKYRLQSIAFKLLKKTKGERLKIHRLIKYFPDQNELQMRQRLKEFMEYHRKGEHQGFWRLKATTKVPDSEEILKLVTPESVALCEAMQVGQRHLLDAGYGDSAGDGGDDADPTGGDETKLSIEQQLAPWITTKNFVNATQSKAMLKLHGEGDPSGRGEAFSFIRVSMKDIFLRAGEDPEKVKAEIEARPKHAHRYNVAEQQKVYKAEIARIWKAQYDSLSNPVPPELSDHEEEEPPRRAQAGHGRFPHAGSVGTPASYRRSESVMSRDSTPDRDDAMSVGSRGDRYGGSSKVLKIRRLVKGVWETEIVRDPAVINAYVRKRQIIEEQSLAADAILPTGDADKDKRRKKLLEEEIMKLKRNQERRLQRKNAKLAQSGGVPIKMNRPAKPDTTRKCGHCGQLGHMKTNRKCPLWAQFNGGGAASPAGGSSAPSPAASGSALPPLGSGLDSGLTGNFYAAPPPVAAPRAFGNPPTPSPLATSPPYTGGAEFGAPSPAASASGAPKIKLSLGKKGCLM